MSKKGMHTSIEAGNCDWCSSEHFKCVDCDYINTIWEGEYNKPKECESCGLEYLISRTYNREGIEEIEYQIPK